MSEARGTFECPICGFDKPHHHDASMLKWFEDAKSNPQYDVAGQRAHCRTLAESQWRDSERRKEFTEDPVGVLRRTVFKIDEESPDPRYEPWSGRDFAFNVMPWVIQLLERGQHTGEQAKVLLTDVDDMMGVLRCVASAEYTRDEVRDQASMALDRLKARGIGAEGSALS